MQADMNFPVSQDRIAAKSLVLNGLARLRRTLPIEQRLADAPPALRVAYTRLLTDWLHAAMPTTDVLQPEVLEALINMDAVVREQGGLGCYPFSAVDTGIHVSLPNGTVSAMCAIDALAIARLARARTRIVARCLNCGTSVDMRVEENGGLDHDQADRARVHWHDADTQHGSCSQGLCRQIRFLCRACPAPETGDLLTLPQAAAIGNAFFRFQIDLLAAAPGQSGP